MELTAARIAHLGAGAVASGDPGTRATSVVIDSRLAERGSCFVALVAARDGHDFVIDAFRRGAVIAVVARDVGAAPPGAAVVCVRDPAETLRALGQCARDEMGAVTVVGITGSAGKTATKDLMQAALVTTRVVYASPRSYNGTRGVPLTMLGAPAGAEVVIAELGAQFPGDIEAFTRIARPHVGVVTHVGLAHAEHLGGREAIAHDKGALLVALPVEGLAVLNDACDMTPVLARRTHARVLRVGRARSTDVRITDLVLDTELRAGFTLETPWGDVRTRLGLRGEHHAENAAMAAAVALELGADPEAVGAGLEQVSGAPNRMELITLPLGARVINDAYNSSPTSAAAALRSLAVLDVPGRRIAVLGEMRELGSHAHAAHAALGALSAELGIDLVIVVGSGAGAIATQARTLGVAVVEVGNAEDATAAVLEQVGPSDAVLVKASRACGLERVVAALSSDGARL